MIGRALRCGETNTALKNVLVDVIIRGGLGKRLERISSVSGQLGVEGTEHGIKSKQTGLGRRPDIPERSDGRLARVARFAWFRTRARVVDAAGLTRETAEHNSVGKVVIGRDQQIEHDAVVIAEDNPGGRRIEGVLRIEVHVREAGSHNGDEGGAQPGHWCAVVKDHDLASLIVHLDADLEPGVVWENICY